MQTPVDEEMSTTTLVEVDALPYGTADEAAATATADGEDDAR